MSANVRQDLEDLLMREITRISKQGELVIQDFIHALTSHEDLNPKTLKL